MSNSLVSVVSLGALLGSPLALAAMGGFFSERSGVINIALEGKMLTSACVTALVGTATGNPSLGLAAGVLSAVVPSAVHWLITQIFRVDAVVSGMALNAIALGATNFLDKTYTNPNLTGETPLLPINLYYATALVLPILLWAAMRWTRPGLRLQASGSDPDKARQMGVSPLHVRFWALTGTGVLCGLSGAMIVTNAGRFVDGMTAGKGFIALAALILGGWRPIPAAIACFGFGVCEALQIVLQGSKLWGAGIPSEAWSSLPYLATILALAGLAAKNRAPAGIGKL